MDFKKYRRKGFAEMRPVTQEEIDGGIQYLDMYDISVSVVDAENESPKKGDMIARNPNDYSDQWLVARQYFEENFEYEK